MMVSFEHGNGFHNMWGVYVQAVDLLHFEEQLCSLELIS